MSISLISLGNEIEYYLFCPKRTEANFVHEILGWHPVMCILGIQNTKLKFHLEQYLGQLLSSQSCEIDRLLHRL